MIGHIIGAREFVDGTRRPIYEDAQGQYLDNEGEPFHGVWLGSYELPLIVDGQPGARETSETDVLARCVQIVRIACLGGRRHVAAKQARLFLARFEGQSRGCEA